MASIHVQEPLPEDEVNEPIQQTPSDPPETTQPEAPSVDPPSPQIVHGHGVRQTLGRVPKTTLLVVIAFIVLLGALFFLLRDRKDLQEAAAKSNVLGESKTIDEAAELKKEIGKFLELPDDETPTVATVVDADKVKTQSFFANSQNGDKVLLFAKAGKAVLYRPSTKKIIEIAPINLNNTESQQSTTPSTPQTNTINRTPNR